MNAHLTPTVLVVEDHPMFVRALQDLLAVNYPHIDFVVAPTYAAAQAWLIEWQSGLNLRAVFCDLTLPDAQGTQVVENIRLLVDAPILVISAEYAESVVSTVQAMGVAAFVSKRSSVDELLNGIAELLGPPQPRITSIQEKWSLSLGQRKVAHQLINGLSNKEIAKALQLSPDTVKTHVSEIMSRLGARNRTEAVLKLTGRTP
jgi:DNA-binding NarL/FixJ family response regulator